MLSTATKRAASSTATRAFSSQAGHAGVSGAKLDGIARFYKTADVKEVEDETNGKKEYAVVLDGKTVKTPAFRPLRLPSRSMAFAVAQEWDAQEKEIRPATMPMMTLASTAIDFDRSSTVSEVVKEIMRYFHSDTLCYQVTGDQQDKLESLQERKWGPIRKWFSDKFDGEVDVSHGTIGAIKHDDTLVANVKDHLDNLSVMELIGLRTLTKECKSLIAAMAIKERHLSAKEAMDLARVEEEFQIERWGLVEGGHDLDRANASVRISSASVLLWLLQHQN